MVQLLLTFDPRLVEKVVTLLNSILEVGSHTGGRMGGGRMGGGWITHCITKLNCCNYHWRKEGGWEEGGWEEGGRRKDGRRGEGGGPGERLRKGKREEGRREDGRKE